MTSICSGFWNGRCGGLDSTSVREQTGGVAVEPLAEIQHRIPAQRDPLRRLGLILKRVDLERQRKAVTRQRRHRIVASMARGVGTRTDWLLKLVDEIREEQLARRKRRT